MEQFKTYTVKARETRAVWVFKYYLEGGLRSFVVLEGSFSEQQSNWLFIKGRFPSNEDEMKSFAKTYRKHFEVEVIIPEITFDYFYEIYGKKTTKKQASDFWRKMKEADKVLAVLGVRKYKNYCKMHQNREQVDPVRYLKHRRYEDEF